MKWKDSSICLIPRPPNQFLWFPEFRGSKISFKAANFLSLCSFSLPFHSPLPSSLSSDRPTAYNACRSLDVIGRLREWRHNTRSTWNTRSSKNSSLISEFLGLERIFKMVDCLSYNRFYFFFFRLGLHSVLLLATSERERCCWKVISELLSFAYYKKFFT